MIADWLSRSVDDIEGDEEVESIRVPAFPVEPIPTGPRVFAPYVPREQQFRDGYAKMSESDLRQTFEGPDGLKYGFKSKKLYVPPGLRETLLYWFHASRYGGHCGVNRTLRRIARWVWWPGMSADVRQFVGQCLICLRHNPTQPKTLRGLLEKPVPLQLISLDHVGPRKWGDRTVYYLVMIDHATRFMVATLMETISGAETKRALEERWVSVFQAPKRF